MSIVTFMGVMAWAILAALAGIIIYACVKEPPWKEIKRLINELDEGEENNE